jgi:hypothetical protein
VRCPFVLRSTLAGLLTLAIVASVTRGQPAAFSPPPRVFYATRYLGDERLHAELKLTPEQVKKVTAWANAAQPFFGGRANAANLDERLKVREKELAEILKPGQAKRLREVLYQQMERIPVGPLVLAGDDEVGKALKLTDDQKARMRARESLDAVLTADQKKGWEKLRGAPFTETLAMSFPFRSVVSVPERLQYLEQDPVRVDLKLTEKQRAGSEALRKEWEKDAPLTRFPQSSEEARKATVRAADFEKRADALLDAGQVKRLDQIVLQQAFTNGRDSDAFSHPKVVAALKMDGKQQEKIRAARAERQTGLLAIFVRDEAVAEIARRVKEHKKETYGQLHALLSAEQQARLKEVIGEPFKGEINLRFGGISGALPRALTAPVYLVMAGVVLFADSKALHEELKLTKGRVEKLLQLQAKARAERLLVAGPTVDAEAEKKRKAQAEAMEKELAGVLDAAQVKRFKQLILQTYVSRAGGARFAAPAAIRNRNLTRLFEVQQGLKLSEEQKKKMLDGTEIGKVLDAGQMATWKEMLGKPFAGNLRPGFVGGPGGRQPPTLTVQALETKAIQAELKLTEKQVEAVRELDKKYQEKASGGPVGNFQDFLKQRQAAQAELDAGCKKFLDAGQAKRLDEIILQHAYRGGLNSLLLQPVAIAGLDLDEKQTARLADLRRDNSELLMLFRREFITVPRTSRATVQRAAPDRSISEAQATMTAHFQKKIEQTLTDAQKDKLKRLLGQPFEGRIDTSRGGFVGGFVGP